MGKQDLKQEIKNWWGCHMLRAEAGVAGDLEQVAVCDRALAGDLDAQAECERVISDASAMES